MDKIIKIEKESKRLVSGATCKTNLALMDIECGWIDLISRKNTKSLCLMYKIINDQGPSYLKNMFNNLLVEPHDYNLRNSQIRIPRARIQTFKKSFFLETLRIWNNLDQNIRDSPTFSIFKSHVKKKDKNRHLFRYGPRYSQIILSRIRMGCSALNSHLFHFLKVLDSPACMCGYHSETPAHFFLSCPIYAAYRDKMLRTLNNITVVNINILLFGNKELTLSDNKLIFDAIFLYLTETKRFSRCCSNF